MSSLEYEEGLGICGGRVEVDHLVPYRNGDGQYRRIDHAVGEGDCSLERHEERDSAREAHDEERGGVRPPVGHGDADVDLLEDHG